MKISPRRPEVVRVNSLKVAHSPVLSVRQYHGSPERPADSCIESPCPWTDGAPTCWSPTSEGYEVEEDIDGDDMQHQHQHGHPQDHALGIPHEYIDEYVEEDIQSCVGDEHNRWGASLPSSPAHSTHRNALCRAVFSRHAYSNHSSNYQGGLGSDHGDVASRSLHTPTLTLHSIRILYSMHDFHSLDTLFLFLCPHTLSLPSLHPSSFVSITLFMSDIVCLFCMSCFNDPNMVSTLRIVHHASAIDALDTLYTLRFA